MAVKDRKRVNISIDPAVHSEMQKWLEVGGMDFSGFVEMISVRWLGSMRPMFRRLEEVQKGGAALSPAEVRVMFLQMLGEVHVEAGEAVGQLLKELDGVQVAPEEQKEVLVLTDAGREQVQIHTDKPKRGRKAAPKK